MDTRLLPAFGLAMLAMAALTGMDVAAKFLTRDFAIDQIVFMRFVAPAVLLGLFIMLTRRAWPQRRYLPATSFRAILVALTGFFFFSAIATLPLATVTAIAMLGPVITAIAGVFVFGESWNRALSLAMALALGGALIIVLGADQSPFGANGDLMSWAAALLVPFTYSAMVILLKIHAVREGAVAIAFSQAVMVALIMAPFMITGATMPSGDQWWPVIAVGLLGTIGALAMTRALKVLPASMFAFVDYQAPIWAAAFGFIFFAEWPNPAVWIGTALIISGSVFAATRRAPAGSAAAQPSG